MISKRFMVVDKFDESGEHILAIFDRKNMIIHHYAVDWKSYNLYKCEDEFNVMPNYFAFRA